MTEEGRRKRIEELLLLVETSEALESDVLELNQMLRDHPGLCRTVVESLSFDAMLLDEFRAESSLLQFTELPEDEFADDLPERETPVVSTSLVSPPKSDFSLRAFYWFSAISTAALVLIALTLSTLKTDESLQRMELSSNLQMRGLDDPVVTDSQWREPLEEQTAVGALTMSINAKWMPPMKVGDLVHVGDVTLLSGQGRIHMTDGVILSIDAQDSPAGLSLKQDGSVTVHQGQVIADVSEEALGFTLRTPSTQIIDVGTRFEVAVDETGISKVEVLDGAVSCLPMEGIAQRNRSMLLPGAPVRFDSPSDQMGVPIEESPFSNERLTEVSRFDSQSRDSQMLLASDMFDYEIGVINHAERGQGWDSRWFAASNRGQVANAVVRLGTYIGSLPWLAPREPNYVVVPSASRCARALSTPVDLDGERPVFISLYMRKRRLQPVGTALSGAGIAFMASETMDTDVADLRHSDIAFALSHDLRDNLTVSTGDKRFVGGRDLECDKTYFVVIKIDLRKGESDNIMARVFDQNDAPQVVEPEKWDSISVPFEQTGYLRKVHLWANASAVVAFDDLRMGYTWESVVPIRF